MLEALVVGYSQDNQCPSPTSSQLEDVIGKIIEEGDNLGTTVIDLVDSHIVCREFDTQQDFLHLVSVVVRTGHANWPPSTVMEQIEAGCVN